MDEIEIRTSMEEPEEKQRSVVSLLFLEAGVFGILLLFHSLKGISFSEGIVYSAAALLCWAIWFTYFGSRKAYLALVLAAVAGYGAAVFLKENVFQEQIRYIVHCVMGGVNLEPIDVTETALLLAAMLSFFVAMSEFLIRSHTLLYLLTTLLLVLSPLLGIRTGGGAVLLLALFQISFAAIQADGAAGWKLTFDGGNAHSASRDDGKVYGVSGDRRKTRSISAKSATVAAMALAGIFLVTFPLAAGNAEELYEIVYDAERRVHQVMNRLTGSQAGLVSGGEMSRGNNYHIGTPHLELEVDIAPSEALYLCGFHGSEYTGNGWEGNGDGAVLWEVERKLGWQAYGNGDSAVGELYQNMYFMMMSMKKNDEPPVERNLLVRHLNGDYRNLYMPYYSRKGWAWEWDQGVFDGYIFAYYEQKDMDVDWDDVYEEFEIIRDWYRELQEAYAEEAQVAYTKVPVQILPQLSALCHNHPQGSLEEITAFILYTLQSSAKYTLTPGWAPLNEDIVEYFLFESGRGYCEHFAAAATLMYRLYGIPARYAAGYMVQPSAFEQQENGSWKAVVTDQAAHAWVEIFLEDYGWTPVEVTPDADGASVAAYPGFDNARYHQLAAEKGWNRENGEALSGQRNQEPGTGQAEFLKWDFALGLEEKWLSALVTCVVYSVLLFPFFLDYRRLRQLKRLETWNSRKVFYQVLEMLRFAGILEGYDGTEADFAPKLAQATGISGEAAARMQEIVTEAAYGFPGESAENDVVARQIYLQLAEKLYQNLKWYRKILFRYGKGFW